MTKKWGEVKYKEDSPMWQDVKESAYWFHIEYATVLPTIPTFVLERDLDYYHALTLRNLNVCPIWAWVWSRRLARVGMELLNRKESLR
jgi:hypothetical protein